MSDLGRFLALERMCCPFLRFELVVSSEEFSQLTITALEDGREFVEKTFGIAVSQ